ncbi:MAG: crotonobetainyl-CoA--carnitine CoA-transferase, partial [Bacteroidia bacterium]|nr:crotonobetainyl-CoA--carnitine CoA-transferase [Bacteroidia bacterium]
MRAKFVSHFKNCPIPDQEIMQNLGLFLSSKNLSRILFMDHLYQQIVDVHGIVIEFGTRWGQNIALFSALRGIY